MGLVLLGEPDLVTILGDFCKKDSYKIDSLNWLNSLKKGKNSLAGGLFFPKRAAFLLGYDIENRIFEVLHPYLKESKNSMFAQSGMSLVKALASLTPLMKDFGVHACDAMTLFNDALCEKAKKK